MSGTDFEIYGLLKEIKILLSKILQEIQTQNSAMSGEQVVKTSAEIAQVPRRDGVSLKDDIEARVKQITKDVQVVEEGNDVLVFPTKFLGREVFNKLSELVSGRGGRYSSKMESGRAHFIVPKE